MTFEVTKRNELFTELLLVEPQMLVRVPRTWNINSPSFKMDRIDIDTFERDAELRFGPYGPGLEYMRTAYRARETEGDITFQTIALMECLPGPLERKTPDSRAYGEVELIYAREKEASEWARLDHQRLSEKFSSIDGMLSPSLIESKINGVDMFAFSTSDSSNPADPVIKRRSYLQTDSGALLFIETYYQASEKIAKQTASIVRRTKPAP